MIGFGPQAGTINGLSTIQGLAFINALCALLSNQVHILMDIFLVAKMNDKYL